MEKYSLPDLFWIKRIKKNQLKTPKTEVWVEKTVIDKLMHFSRHLFKALAHLTKN